ncbi:MAG: SURF1 family protein [Rubrivivax sp.]|nr:SURF1 family protein [Rubrivivax sp.]
MSAFLDPATRRTVVVWLAALAVIALTARLGLWQLDRAAQKVALHELRLQRLRAPPLTLAELPGTAEAARAAEQRLAAVTGRWLPEHTVYLDNRPLGGPGGRVGFLVLTPLALDDGRVLLVLRGWWPRRADDRTRVDAPPPPGGAVSVAGRVALAPARLFELAAEGAGPIRQNLDLDAFARETRLPLLPWLLVQRDDPAAPTNDGLLRGQGPEPAPDVHKHYGYAVQWFAMCALVAALLLWFGVLQPWRRRRTP